MIRNPKRNRVMCVLLVGIGAGAVLAAMQVVEQRFATVTLKPNISSAQAIKIAAPTITLMPGWKAATQLRVIGGSQLQWTVKAAGTKRSVYSANYGQREYQMIQVRTVNAQSGEIVLQYEEKPADRKSVKIRPPIPSPELVLQDTDPFWPGPNKPVSFVTSRLSYDTFIGSKAHKSERNEMFYKSAVASVNKAGDISVLLKIPYQVFNPAWSPDGTRLAFDMGQRVYVADMKSGTIGRCNDGVNIERAMPSWDPTGELLAMAGTRADSDAGAMDIYVAKVSKKLGFNSVEQQWCVARLPNADSVPVFSLDGKWIVFAHEDRIKRTPLKEERVLDPDGEDPWLPADSPEIRHWSLYRVKATKPQGGPEPPEKIVEGLPEPGRLSWFPDGNRLLVSFVKYDEQGVNPPEVVNIEAKQSKILPLARLRDPDLLNGPELQPNDVTVTHLGTKLAFSALRWTGVAKSEGNFCIYTCNLDGTGLRRWTPPGRKAMVIKKFAPDATALNAWEKLDPKPNTGRTWTPLLQQQERELELKKLPPKAAP